MLGAREKQKRQIAGIDQDELLEPALLADPDSCFCEFKGVQIHHKICDAEPRNLSGGEGSGSQSLYPSKRLNFPMILLHGFGASVFSWNRAMKQLASISGSKVLAFDRPAFGLTSRPNPVVQSSPGMGDARALNPYSVMFSVLATLHFIDFLAAEKAVLVGYVQFHFSFFNWSRHLIRCLLIFLQLNCSGNGVFHSFICILKAEFFCYKLTRSQTLSRFPCSS